MNNPYIEGLSFNDQDWRKKKSNEMVTEFDEETLVTDGVVRWKSNNRIPSSELIEFWSYVGKDFDIAKTKATKKKEDSDFIESYKLSQENKIYSNEELFEMEAAFGKDATIIDVITGKKIKL